MSRFPLGLILVAALILSVPNAAQAQWGVCPCRAAYAQMTIWIQQQPQIQQQQAMVRWQQQYMRRTNPGMGNPGMGRIPNQKNDTGSSTRYTPQRTSSSTTRTNTSSNRSSSSINTARYSAHLTFYHYTGPGLGLDLIGYRYTASSERIRNTTYQYQPATTQRTTSENRTVYRPQTTTYSARTTTYKPTSNVYRQTTPTCPSKQTASTARNTNVQVTRPPPLAIRITVPLACGMCHHRTGPPTQNGGQPGLPDLVARLKPDRQVPMEKKLRAPFMQGNQPRLPFQQGAQPPREFVVAKPPAQRPLDRPVQPIRPGQLSVVRADQNPLQPAINPGGPAPGFVIGQPPLPILQPPQLPPLAGGVAGGPLHPLPGLMRAADGPKDARQPTTSLLPEATAPGAAKPPATLDAPALPNLEASVVQLNPLLGAKGSNPVETEIPRSDLPTDDLTAAPALETVPGMLAIDRGLLPTINRINRSEPDVFDPSARPSPLDLVMQPPPLSEIVNR